MMKNSYLLKPLKNRNLQAGNCAFVSNSEKGFTLLEVLVVAFIITILAALGFPSLLQMRNNSVLNKGQDAVTLAISNAQAKARQRKVSMQASFRQNGNYIEWAVHPPLDPTTLPENAWQKIEERDLTINGSNLGGTESPWTIEFDDRGQLANEEQTGEKIVLSITNGGSSRCAIVQTLLGTIRKARGSDCTVP